MNFLTLLALASVACEVLGATVHAQDELPAARLSTDPLGTNRDIGRELDLALVLREWRKLELTFKWSRFTPGAAFASNRRDSARAIELGLSVNF